MNASSFRHELRIAAVVVLCGCASSHDTTSPPSPPASSAGVLAVTIENLPAGAAAAVTLGNGAGYTQLVTASQTLTNLTLGTYTLTSTAVTANGNRPIRLRFQSQTVVVGGGSTAQSTVTYGTAPQNVCSDHRRDFMTRSMIVDGVTYGYQIYIPQGYDPTVAQRVILFCHGSDEGGHRQQRPDPGGAGTVYHEQQQHHPRCRCLSADAVRTGRWSGGSAHCLPHHEDRARPDRCRGTHRFEPRSDHRYLWRGDVFTWMMAYQEPTRIRSDGANAAQWVIAKRMLINDSASFFSQGRRSRSRDCRHCRSHEYWWGENDSSPNYQTDGKGLAGNPNYSLIEVAGADHGESWDETYASTAFWTWFRAQHR